MSRVRRPSSRLDGISPYDPKYLPAEVRLSANENPRDVDPDIRRRIASAIEDTPLNRYPDPLANELREVIAVANGLDRDCVLMGNGGDELLFDLSLAWGGSGRTFLNLPPTFSVYESNARLTGTALVEVPRCSDFSIDEDAVLDRVSQGDIDFMVIGSPNNPTGLMVPTEFLVRLLDTTDALVMVDEAYFEFSRQTVRPYLAEHENLLILRTFSKAFSLAGVRMGYILGHPDVIREFEKVRQPYSVDAVSQAIARVVYENRADFERGIIAIIEERERLFDALVKMRDVVPYPSDANWVLFRTGQAKKAWDYLYEHGVLVRDFSDVAMLDDTLRVTVGTHEENNLFLHYLEEFAAS